MLAIQILGQGQEATPMTLAPEAIGIHLRQIRRYAFASSQDKSPIIGLTHANYALVLLDTLEEIVSRSVIERTGIDVAKIRAFIVTLQDRHAAQLQRCDRHLQRILKIERREGGSLPGIVQA